MSSEYFFLSIVFLCLINSDQSVESRARNVVFIHHKYIHQVLCCVNNLQARPVSNLPHLEHLVIASTGQSFAVPEQHHCVDISLVCVFYGFTQFAVRPIPDLDAAIIRPTGYRLTVQSHHTMYGLCVLR